MNEKLKQAVQAIKEGEKQAGFKMVQEIIQEQPRHADAWYVMAGLVKGEQREKCLRQVLKINPTHIQARKALHELEERPPIDPVAEDTVPREEPIHERPEDAPTEPEVDPTGETWPGSSSYGAPPIQSSASEEPEAEAPTAGEDAFPEQPTRLRTETEEGRRPESAESEAQAQEADTSRSLPTVEDLNLPRQWKYTSRSKTRLTLITAESVIKAEADEGQLAELEPPFKGEPLAEADLLDKIVIPLEAVQKIRQMMSSVRIFYEEEGQEISVLLDLEDAEAAEQVLAVLRILLGEDFQASAEQMSPLTALGLSVVYLGIAAGITAFGLWGAAEIAAGNVQPRGSAFTRTVIMILDTLGPVGVGIIGGVLILIALAVSGVMLLNPPTVRILVRKGTEDI